MENNRGTWLVMEDYDGSIAAAHKGGILALTPEAAYSLGKAGLKYSILEDFYSVEELIAGEDAYFSEQLEWAGKLDALFRRHIPLAAEMPVGVVRSHFYQLKYFVDSLVIQVRLTDWFIRRSGASALIYTAVTRDRSFPGDGIYGISNNRRLFSCDIASMLCAKYNLPFFESLSGALEEQERADERAPELPKGSAARNCIKAAYNFLRYGKAKRYLSSSGKGLKVLSLHAGGLSMDIVLRELITSGAEVFLKSEGKVTALSSFTERTALDLSGPARRIPAEISSRCRRVYEDLAMDAELAGWADRKAGAPVSSLALPYFRHFIEEICAKDLSEEPLIANFFRREKIDLVIARSSSEKESVSSLMAAAAEGKRVCFQHSCSALDSSLYHISEMDLFDHYFTMNADADMHMTAVLRDDHVSPCALHSSPHHLKAVKDRWGSSKRDKDLVMYVPAKMFFGGRYYNDNFYPISWYFEMQKALIDLFAAKSGKRFIFKYAPGQEWCDGSTLRYISDKGARNISIEKRPVSECLGKAGKVLLDFPSTSFYEAAAAGIPVMSLCHESFRLRPEAARLFGGALRVFKGIEEALAYAEEFIDSDPAPYKADIPMPGGPGIVTELKRIKDARLSMAGYRKAVSVV